MFFAEKIGWFHGDTVVNCTTQSFHFMANHKYMHKELKCKFLFLILFSDAYATIAYILGYLTKVKPLTTSEYSHYLFKDESSMSESLRAIDKTTSQCKDIKDKLRKFESVFDR